MLSCCVSLVSVPFLVFLNCSLWVYVWSTGNCFSICFRMSSKGHVTMCLSNWSWRYCLAVICVGFTCLLFLVISHPVFVMCIVYDLWWWLWSPFPTIAPGVHSQSPSYWPATEDLLWKRAYFWEVLWFLSYFVCLFLMPHNAHHHYLDRLVVY